ncbi:MAG: SDR family oxidoreductase [Elusimicrobiota bacterium]|nr:SDR family oxidoreductase [Elusimicrobiota bacterium]
MALYLVTGGAGFIGSNICQELVKRGESVRILDDFSTGKRENIVGFKDNVQLIEGDIRNLEIVKRAMKGVDFVLHQGALPSVERSVKDPLTTTRVNVLGTLNVLLAAREAKVKRVIYASSSSVYGDTPTLPKKEEMKANPQSPYAVTKLIGEEYCRIYYSIYGLETVCLRYFNVFGPRQDPGSQYAAVIPKFITLMLKGKSPPIYGDGEQSRDFSFIDNVIEANLQACKAKEGPGKVLNIACGKRVTINELVKRLNRILHTGIEPAYENPRKGDVRHSLADISKARKILHYSPEIEFAEGLEKTVQWFQKKLCRN